MNLTRAAINRPIFIFMLVVAAFLLGGICYSGMRKELNPDISFGTLVVSTSYPGASPEDVNQLISKKIEDAVSGVSGIRQVNSTSQEGFSTVVIQLELGTDLDAAVNDVRSKVDQVTSSLPKDALKPQVLKFDTTSSPVLDLALSSTKLTSKQLRDLIDDKISDRFAQITGVVAVGVSGGDVREIQVQLSKDKLLQYGMGIADVQQALAAASLNTPAGHLVNGPQDYTVRVVGEFETPEQVRNMVISINDPKNFNGRASNVHLSDIATVLDSSVERTDYARLDGRDTIAIALQKAKDGNSVEIQKAADDLIKTLETEYASVGLKFTITYQDAQQITDSLSDLQFSLCFGVLLVATIVFVFLHNLRGTFIVAIAIPTCIFCSFIGMKLLGFTINSMTMLSLQLAIGVLVDDAIVVLENIYRHLRLGEDPRDAALNGRGEIGMAAIAITMADVVVFLPIGFMGGIVGAFFKPMALGFVCAVLFSLFVSFTLTPLLAARWYKAGEDMEHPVGGFARWFEARFHALESHYRNSLEWALHHRWFVFISGWMVLLGVMDFIAGGSATDAKTAISGGFGALFMAALIIGVIVFVVNGIRSRNWRLKYIGSAVAFGLVFPLMTFSGYAFHQWKGEDVFKFQFLPDADNGQVTANIQMPPGTSLDSTLLVAKQIEKTFRAQRDMKYVLTTVGEQGAGGFNTAASGSNYASVSGTLFDKRAMTDSLPWSHHEGKLRTRSDKSISAELTEEIGRIPGAQISIGTSGGGFGSGIQLNFTSDDHELLLATAQKVRDALASGAVKGVINPQLSVSEGKPELQIVPKREDLADSGLTPEQLGNAVSILYQGNNDTKLRHNGREYDIRVMMDYADRNDPQVMNEVPITFVQGNPVFIPSVATIRQAPGVNQITRQDRAEQIAVTADLLPGFANGSVSQQVSTWLTAAHMVPEGVNFKQGGQADAMAREGGFIMGAFLLGIVLVYMLLASLYDNLLYPFIIQLAQPQAMVGALLALIITNKDLNVIGIIGIIALVGLVGKNAILVVDYTNTLRDRGRSRHDALVEAGPTRLRPIMMTTMALILGMLPVAIAIGRGSEFRETIGITIIGGISLSTLLTLLVIPCSYTIFDDVTLAIARRMGKKGQHTGGDRFLTGEERIETTEALPLP